MSINTSRVSSQFKTTIPKQIRETANIGDGAFLQWECNEDGTLLIRPVLPVGIDKGE